MLRYATLKKEKERKERRHSGPGSNKVISTDSIFVSKETRKNWKMVSFFETVQTEKNPIWFQDW